MQPSNLLLLSRSMSCFARILLLYSMVSSVYGFFYSMYEDCIERCLMKNCFFIHYPVVTVININFAFGTPHICHHYTSFCFVNGIWSRCRSNLPSPLYCTSKLKRHHNKNENLPAPTKESVSHLNFRDFFSEVPYKVAT